MVPKSGVKFTAHEAGVKAFFGGGGEYVSYFRSLESLG